MDLHDTYNRIAEDWFRDHEADTWWVAGTDAFAAFLSQDSLVLDVGCGGGMKTRYLLDKGLRVIGADFAENMIAIAKREVPEAQFRVADIRDLRTLPESFDGIFAQAVLLHLHKTEAPGVIAGMRDKLKNGGYLYIAVKEARPDRPEEAVAVENDYGYPYERFFSYYTLPELKKYLADAGLRVSYEDVSRTGHTNWIQVIAQK